MAAAELKLKAEPQVRPLRQDDARGVAMLVFFVRDATPPAGPLFSGAGGTC